MNSNWIDQRIPWLPRMVAKGAAALFKCLVPEGRLSYATCLSQRTMDLTRLPRRKRMFSKDKESSMCFKDTNIIELKKMFRKLLVAHTFLIKQHQHSGFVWYLLLPAQVIRT